MVAAGACFVPRTERERERESLNELFFNFPFDEYARKVDLNGEFFDRLRYT